MLNTLKLLAGVIAKNPRASALTLDDVSFSNPTPNPDVTSAWNTVITMTGKSGSTVSGSEGLFYHRIDLGDFGSVELEFTDEPTLADVVAAINTTYGTELDESDLVAVTFPDVDTTGDAVTVNLVAKATSIGWVNNVQIVLAYNLPNVDALYAFFTQTLTAPGYV